MTRRRAKAATLFLVTLGVCALVVCALAFKDTVLEWYYLRKLESGDLQEQQVAAEKLGEMGSVRSVPVLLKGLRNTDEEGLRLLAWIRDPKIVARSRDDEFVVEALGRIADLSGKRCALYLAKELSEEDPRTRSLIAVFLGTIGLDATVAVRPLIEVLNTEGNDRVRVQAVWALSQLGPEAKGAIPALTEALHDGNELVRQAAAEALKKVQRHEHPPR